MAATPAEAVVGGSVGRSGDALAASTVAVAVVEGGGSGLSYCSGVLVSRRDVLTAAHCVEGRPRAAAVFVSGGGRLTRYSAVSVQRYSYPNDTGQELLSRLTLDVALLRLDRPVAGVRPAHLAAPGGALPATLRLAGRGFSGQSLGAVRTTTLVPVAATPSGLIIAQAQGSLVCKGDSGGPVAAGSRDPVIVGVASAVITRLPNCGALVIVAPARRG